MEVHDVHVQETPLGLSGFLCTRVGSLLTWRVAEAQTQKHKPTPNPSKSYLALGQKRVLKKPERQNGLNFVLFYRAFLFDAMAV